MNKLTVLDKRYPSIVYWNSPYDDWFFNDFHRLLRSLSVGNATPVMLSCSGTDCTNSTEQSPSEVNSHSATQEIARFLRNTVLRYCIRKRQTLVPILSQMNSVHTFPSYFS